MSADVDEQVNDAELVAARFRRDPKLFSAHDDMEHDRATGKLVVRVRH